MRRGLGTRDWHIQGTDQIRKYTENNESDFLPNNLSEEVCAHVKGDMNTK